MVCNSTVYLQYIRTCIKWYITYTEEIPTYKFEVWDYRKYSDPQQKCYNLGHKLVSLIFIRYIHHLMNDLT